MKPSVEGMKCNYAWYGKQTSPVWVVYGFGGVNGQNGQFNHARMNNGSYSNNLFVSQNSHSRSSAKTKNFSQMKVTVSGIEPSLIIIDQMSLK